MRIKDVMSSFIDKIQSYVDETAPTSFRQKLVYYYAKKVKSELESLRSEHLSDAELLLRFRYYLQTNHERISGSFLDYTALPYNVVTEGMILLSELLSHKLNTSKEPAEWVHPLELLYPGFKFVSEHNAHPTLLFENNVVPRYDTRQFIASHILSSDKSHLIPVSEGVSPEPRHVYDVDSVHNHLTLDEQSRIYKFNPTMQIYAELQRKYQALVSNNQHFLSHVQKLHDELKKFDAHGGVGKPDSTGSGSYQALVNFNTYYSELAPDLKAKIPQDMQSYIEQMFTLGSTLNAGQTCTGIMRETLADFITKYRLQLIEIQLNPEQQAAELASIEKQINTIRNSKDENFWHAETDDAADMLPFTYSILKFLEINLSIKAKKDWEAFMDLNADEIESLVLADEELKQSLFIHLRTQQEWIDFFKNYSPEKIKLFFRLTADQAEKYPNYSDYQAWAELLIEITNEKFAVVISSFVGSILRSLDSTNLKRLFNALDPSNQEVMINTIIECSPDVIKDYIILERMFRLPEELFTPEHRRILLEAIQPELGAIITSFDDLTKLFGLSKKQLNTEHRQTLLCAIKPNLGTMIPNFEDIIKFFQLPVEQLNVKQRQIKLNAIKPYLDTIITNFENFINLFKLSAKELTAAHRDTIIDAIKPNLGEMIKNADDLAKLFELSETELTAKHRDIIIDVIKPNLGKMIKNADDLTKLLKLSEKQLTAAHRDIIMDAIKPNLSRIIKSFYALTEIFQLPEKQLKLEHRKIISAAIQPNLANIIKNVEGLDKVFALIEAPLDKVIQRSKRLDYLLRAYFMKQPSKDSFNDISTVLKEIIKSKDDLMRLFCCPVETFSPEYRTVFLTDFGPKIGEILSDDESCAVVFGLGEELLNQEQRLQIMLAVISDKLQHYGSDQTKSRCNELLNKMKDSLVSKDFNSISKYLEKLIRNVHKEEGLWYQLHPIFKRCVGILAALTVVPAIIINMVSDKGFSGTFFQSYKTDLDRVLSLTRNCIQSDSDSVKMDKPKI